MDNLQKQIYECLGKEYSAIFIIDLENDYLENIISYSDTEFAILKSGCYSEQISKLAELMEEHYKEMFLNFASIDYLLDVFEEEDRTEIEYKLKEGENPWKKVVFQVMERKESKPSKIIMAHVVLDYFRNKKIEQDRINDEQNVLLKEQLRREGQYRRALIEGAGAVYEVNLTQDILMRAVGFYDNKEVRLAGRVGLETPCGYSEYVDRYAERMSEEDSRQFKEKSSRESLLNSFRKKEFVPYDEYSSKDAKRQVTYFRKMYVLTKDTETGDVFALIIVRDITEQKRIEVLQRDVINAISSEFTSIYLVDWDTGKVRLFKSNNKYISIMNTVKGIENSDEALQKYAENAVHSDDREKFIKESKIDNIRRILGKQKSFDINFKRVINDETDYAQMHCVRVDGSLGSVDIVLAFRSISEMVEKERLQKMLVEDNMRNMNVVKALSDEFTYVYHIDPVTERFTVYCYDDVVEEHVDISVESGILYSDAYEHYISEFVCDDDKVFMHKYSNIQNILKELENKKTFTHNYRACFNGKISYYQMKCVKVEEYGRITGIVIGLCDKDDEIRKQKEYEEKLKAALDEANEAVRINKRHQNILYSMMADSYTSATKINLETGQCYMLSIKDNQYIETEYTGGWNALVETYLECMHTDDADRLRVIYKEDLYQFEIGEIKKYFYRYKCQKQQADGIREYEVHTSTVRILEEEGNRIATVFTCDNTAIFEAEQKERELFAEKELLRAKSRKDGLTGLLNKETMMEETTYFLENNSAKNVALIFFDLDHFKSVNDTLGHSMGDVAIKDAAKKLQIIFANCDYIGRFGGDEFCVLVKDIPKSTLVDKLQWALERLREKYVSADITVDITTSIGCAYCIANHAEYKPLLDLADEAVYEAKNTGRDKYVIKVYR